MIALYLLMGKALGMSDIAYGIRAGTSVNDTASLVASGYASTAGLLGANYPAMEHSPNSL